MKIYYDQLKNALTHFNCGRYTCVTTKAAKIKPIRDQHGNIIYKDIIRDNIETKYLLAVRTRYKDDSFATIGSVEQIEVNLEELYA